MGRKTIVIWILLAALLVGTLAMSYARWSENLDVSQTVITRDFNDCFSWIASNDSGTLENVAGYSPIDPGDDGVDPEQFQTAGQTADRCDKDVALTSAVLEDEFNASVTLSNGYHYYYATVFFGIRNGGGVPSTIASIEIDENTATPDIQEDLAEITVIVDAIYVGRVLNPGEEVTGVLQIRVEQCCSQGASYGIKLTVTSSLWCLGGTPGFWKNWDSHDTYNQDVVEQWLAAIDDESDWLGPTATESMESVLDAYQWLSMEDKFIAQYLATRLDVEAARLTPASSHDISVIDGYEYLGLTDSASATLIQIIDAIESKHGANPEEDQFEAMKDICDGLNQLEI